MTGHTSCTACTESTVIIVCCGSRYIFLVLPTATVPPISAGIGYHLKPSWSWPFIYGMFLPCIIYLKKSTTMHMDASCRAHTHKNLEATNFGFISNSWGLAWTYFEEFKKKNGFDDLQKYLHNYCSRARGWSWLASFPSMQGAWTGLQNASSSWCHFNGKPYKEN